jgi:hypothetical protein
MGQQPDLQPQLRTYLYLNIKKRKNKPKSFLEEIQWTGSQIRQPEPEVRMPV